MKDECTIAEPNWRQINFVYFHRRARCWTQKELARRAGVSNQDVCHWEIGRSVPGTSNLKGLAKALGKTTEEILSALLIFEPVERKAKRKD